MTKSTRPCSSPRRSTPSWARLGHDALVSRDTADDGSPGREGTFLLCAFRFVDALLWPGRDEDGAFPGNRPQAFSPLGFVHSAPMRDLFDQGGHDAVRGTHAVRCLRETAFRRGPIVAGA